MVDDKVRERLNAVTEGEISDKSDAEITADLIKEYNEETSGNKNVSLKARGDLSAQIFERMHKRLVELEKWKAEKETEERARKENMEAVKAALDEEFQTEEQLMGANREISDSEREQMERAQAMARMQAHNSVEDTSRADDHFLDE